MPWAKPPALATEFFLAVGTLISTWIKSVPNDSNSLKTKLLRLSPADITIITAEMPIIIPKTVKKVRPRWTRSDFQANCTGKKFIFFLSFDFWILDFEFQSFIS